MGVPVQSSWAIGTHGPIVLFPVGIAQKRVAYCEPAVIANTEYNRTPMLSPTSCNSGKLQR